jgi:hypothetical protein
MEKKCTSCNTVQPTENFRKFSRSKDGLAHQCKTCADVGSERWRQRNLDKRKQQQKDRQVELLEQYQEWKSKQQCAVCGEDESVCLDLHHTDPTQKDDTVSNLVYRTTSWSRVYEEVQKCVVLCANCHRKTHAGLIGE